LIFEEINESSLIPGDCQQDIMQTSRLLYSLLPK
jgi:hypothetical protein